MIRYKLPSSNLSAGDYKPKRPLQLPAINLPQHCKLVLSNKALQLHKVGRPHARYLGVRTVNTSADWQWVQNVLLTGSHPFAAEYPDVPQPGFEPEVMSLNPVAAVE